MRHKFHQLSSIGDLMGVMPRKSGEHFVITSDRIIGEVPSKQAPKKRIAEAFQFWTAEGWSALESATTVVFASIDAADEYIRANYERVMR